MIQVFPEEQKSDYFTPSVRNKRTKSSTASRGVLYDTYHNKRRKYIKLGMIEKRSSTFSAQDGNLKKNCLFHARRKQGTHR